jgi:hypothetical protein
MMLTAYRSNDEPWRIDRLAEVAKSCPRKVIGLHDHKGNLSVNWLTTPNIEELTEVIQAWALKGEWSLEHYVVGLELWAPYSGVNPFEVVT